MKKVGLIAIHGMGKTPIDYADTFFTSIRHLLKEYASEVAFHSVYYDSEMQERENIVFGDMMTAEGLRSSPLRELALYGLADAVGLEARRKQENSDYTKAQKCIARTILETLHELGDPTKPVIFVAQSLGGQVLSNYIWDAQHQKDTRFPTSAGIWVSPLEDPLFSNLSDEEVDFLRLNTMHRLYTTGCNIPIFVAALARDEIVPINKPNIEFKWHNFFDVDDPLGWPLQPLKNGYETIVEDHNIRSGNFIKSLTPFSHNAYWSDSDVLRPLVADIEQLLA